MEGLVRQRLEEALDRSKAFIFVIDRGWDSSTWMATEADAALRRRQNGKLLGFFSYNPASMVVTSVGMQPYLSRALAIDISNATKIIRELST